MDHQEDAAAAFAAEKCFERTRDLKLIFYLLSVVKRHFVSAMRTVIVMLHSLLGFC